MKPAWLPYAVLGALGCFSLAAGLTYFDRDEAPAQTEAEAAPDLFPPGTAELKESALPAAVATAPEPRIPLQGALLDARNATVNILCTTSGSPFRPISGSGVIISPDGIILTAAHIAQYFLLKDYPAPGSIACTIRTGSPSTATFEADLLFVSSHWVTANQTILAENAPTGTGESDFALLYITRSLSGAPLPSPFPYAPLARETVANGERVAIGAYGAEFLAPEQILAGLPVITDEGTVSKRYTFHEDTADLISVSGSLAAQEGSSGGAVLNVKGELVGLITTSSPGSELENRNLRAITPVHVRANFALDQGEPLDAYLKSASLPSLAAAYQERAQALKDILIRALGK